MIRIDSVQESHGPISGSPVEGSGVLFVLQGVLTPEQEGDPEEGYFHAIPLDVFSELVLTQGFSPDNIEEMARHLLLGGDAPMELGSPSQDPDPLLLEVKENERAAVARELRTRRDSRLSPLTDVNEESDEYWDEVASISDLLTGARQGDFRTLLESRENSQREYRRKRPRLAPPGHDLDEESRGWKDFVDRVKQLRAEREKGAQGLVHQLYGDMILRSLTEEEHVLEPRPLPLPEPDHRISQTGRETPAEEDGRT